MQYPNWFEMSDAKDNFVKHLSFYAGQPDLRFLQIGAFTGDASAWLCDNILTDNTSMLVDVDTWSGSDEPVHHEMDWDGVFKMYEIKTRRFNNIMRLKMTSDQYFSGGVETRFDFIYIDGDHTAFGVLRDGMNAYEKCKVGGIIAFDDYTWSLGKGDFYDPRYAIDSLFHLLIGRVEKIEDNGQLWLKKII